MELHPFHRQGFVTQAHDFAVLGPGGDFQTLRKGVAAHRQGEDVKSGHICTQTLPFNGCDRSGNLEQHVLSHPYSGE